MKEDFPQIYTEIEKQVSDAANRAKDNTAADNSGNSDTNNQASPETQANQRQQDGAGRQ